MSIWDTIIIGAGNCLTSDTITLHVLKDGVP